MIIVATYVGPIPHLRGQRALIRNQPSRGWRNAPDAVLARSVFAQFHSMTAQVRPGRRSRAIHKHLGFSWTRFDVRDFRLDPDVFTEVVQTCRVCPSQWEGRLSDGTVFYARYRGARVRIGLHPHSRDGAIDAGINKHPHAEHRRTSVHPLDGCMEWAEIEPFFIKALAAYQPPLSWVERRRSEPLYVETPQEREVAAILREHAEWRACA
ncbi:hypothetical protein MARCHEWKA_03010 [Brevundimonas phage vB_BpoS-Marchewka]|uniref:Uncharacterized protein n=1 Tax=Brevundimonas phage vB_BpoS-Marchewka TaxID=2948604 RepID=A0A9E7N4T8_9CAUD|nr:hypothetical protein MARCHEWKA_03010 [Brevundimonas phage vB_BpoS-Marchewka]UTC29260.1 hypothetical protein BAMBUS_01780 [Brevundimonas phage vB_BpoS-Bambus]